MLVSASVEMFPGADQKMSLELPFSALLELPEQASAVSPVVV